MYRDTVVGVVVPAYNEEKFVGKTIASIPDFVDRIYVIDDGSTDGTWQQILSAADSENARRHLDDASDSRFEEPVVPISHVENRGVGGAIKTGYLHARAESIEITAVMGGDDQMDPEMLGVLFDPIVDGQADYVKGNRLMGRRDRGSMPPLRFAGNALLGILTKIASGYWNLGDPQNGYTAISLRALEDVGIESMYEFYGYCNDLLVKLNIAGLRVVDVPSPIRYGDEQSHIRYRTYIPRVSGMLLRNFLTRLRIKYLTFDFHPLVIAYLAGGVATGAGIVGILRTLIGGQTDQSGLERGYLSLLLSIVGTLSIVGAMVLDKQENDPLNEAIHPQSEDTDFAVANDEPLPARPDLEVPTAGRLGARTNGSSRVRVEVTADEPSKSLERSLSRAAGSHGGQESGDADQQSEPSDDRVS